EVEVTPRPVVGQVHAQLRRTQGADLLARAEDVGDLVRVDPGDGQAVLQAARGTEVEIGVGTEINTVGLQVTLVRVTSHDLGDTADRVAGDAQAGRDLAVLGRIQVHVDQVLRGDRRDGVLDLDVVVVDAQVQPVDRVIHHAERVLLGLLRGQRRVGDEVGVDLRTAGRRLAQRGAGLRIVDRLGREGAGLGQDVQTRGAEALAVRGAQRQVLKRLPAAGDLRREVVAVVAVLAVTASQGDV